MHSRTFGGRRAPLLRFWRVLLGRDPHSAGTIRRILLAFASYMVCYGFILVCYGLGMTRFDGWKLGAMFALIVGCCGGFYFIVRTGLNRRFRDPSLLFPQLYTSLVIISYGLNYAQQARSAVMISYLFAYMFGLFRLDIRGLLRFGGAALLSYGGIILLAWLRQEPGFSPRHEFLQWLGLAFMTPWFALMASSVTVLRKRLKSKNAQLTAAMQRIRMLATHDEVTGCYNRHYIMDLLERHAASARRTGTHFCLCLIDIDHFKHVNDAYGHAAGDHVLMRVAGIAQEGLRNADCFARYGGEEFLLLLAGTQLEDAQACAERIRARIADSLMRHDGEEFCVTVSLGVAQYQASETVKHAIERADKALYRAKNGGRNQCAVAAAESV